MTTDPIASRAKNVTVMTRETPVCKLIGRTVLYRGIFGSAEETKYRGGPSSESRTGRIAASWDDDEKDSRRDIDERIWSEMCAPSIYHSETPHPSSAKQNVS